MLRSLTHHALYLTLMCVDYVERGYACNKTSTRKDRRMRLAEGGCDLFAQALVICAGEAPAGTAELLGL
jgi:hypothetical protein